jgi:hypothetical protein
MIPSTECVLLELITQKCLSHSQLQEQHFQFRQIELTDNDEWDPESVDLTQGMNGKISVVDCKKHFVMNCESDVMLPSVLEALMLSTWSIQAVYWNAKGVIYETRNHMIS